MITISNATSKDFKIIKEIAYATWPDVYGKILSKEQLNFMLSASYSEETLSDNMINKKHHFILVYDEAICIGFASYEHNYLGKKETRLHKIYLLPEAQGKGAGRALIDVVATYALENDSKIISLNVNRFNNACTFYQKMGFTIVGEEDIEIGQGYLMEDYKMEKQL